jgi:transporter family-2 protein
MLQRRNGTLVKDGGFGYAQPPSHVQPPFRSATITLSHLLPIKIPNLKTMSKNIWILLTLVAGAILPIQAGINTRLGKAAANPVWASTISFLVGIVALFLYIIFTRQTPSWAGLKSAPAGYWLGGLLGAYYVTFIIFAFPRLGPGLTFGLIVAGQMIVSMILEHNNILVEHQTPVNPMRILGVILIIAGVVILRKF